MIYTFERFDKSNRFDKNDRHKKFEKFDRYERFDKFYRFDIFTHMTCWVDLKKFLFSLLEAYKKFLQRCI